MEEDGEDGNGNRGRMGEDFRGGKRKERTGTGIGENGNVNRRGWTRDSEEDGNGTRRERKRNF